jgi:hypothetical protein
MFVQSKEFKMYIIVLERIQLKGKVAYFIVSIIFLDYLQGL